MVRFWRDRSGSYAIFAGFLSLPLILAVGLAVDYSRYLSSHAHLQELVDSAALALAASTETDPIKLKQMASNFIDSNANADRIKNIKIVSLDTANNNIDLKLSGHIHAQFMSVVGHDILPSATSALAERAVNGSVEVALVLDNTQSMEYDNKIGTLKTAAAKLVEELFTNSDANVRVALVPYAEQINIGTANRNAAWVNVPTDYDKVVTTTTAGYWTQPMKNTSECKTWKEAGSRVVEKDGVMITESWPRSCSAYVQVPNGPEKWVPEKTTTTTTKYRWYGCIGSRVFDKKLILNDGSPSVPYPGYLNTSQKCLNEIIPLTTAKATLQTAITGMVTSRSGYTPNTYIPGGMMWGINVLSSTAPYTEGVAYDPQNKEPRKVIVLMTDGLNTRRVNVTGTLNKDFLNGGALIGDTNTADATQRVATNTDTTTLCNYAKSKKIEIFTVAFKVDDGDAKTMLKGCATSANHYYDASDSDDLLAAFDGIGQSLRLVRLAR